MTEQSTVEATPATPEGSQAPAPTAEQVEAEYKARLSGKDKAHAAEVATLRAQIEALTGEKVQATSQATEASTDVEALRRQLAEAQTTNKQQAASYEARLRAAKYPYAADALEPEVLGSMDEAKLAGLNERLRPPRQLVGMESSTPPRDASAPKALEDKTVDELKADLARLAPAFEAEMRSDY